MLHSRFALTALLASTCFAPAHAQSIDPKALDRELAAQVDRLIAQASPNAGLNDRQANAIAARLIADPRRNIGTQLTPFEQRVANHVRWSEDYFLELRSKDLLGQVVEEFSKVLSQKDGHLLRSIEFRVTGDSEINARLDPVKRIVRIPIGSVRASRLAFQTSYFVRSDPRLLEYFTEYMKYASRNIYTNRTGTDHVFTYPIWAFAKRSAPTWTASAEKDFEFESITAEYHGLAFLAAHEFCHLKLSHAITGQRAMSIRQEIEADECGLDILAKAEFQGALGGIILTWMGLAASNEDGTMKQMTTHPHPRCRIAGLVDDAFRRDQLDATSQRDLFPGVSGGPTRAEFAALAREVSRDDASECKRRYPAQ